MNLEKLRQKLEKHKLKGYLLPHSDMFQGEYLVSRDEWLAWLSGFTGSAGFSVILNDKAALFVDGRYTLQTAQQVNQDWFEIHPLGTEDIWLKENAPSDVAIGFDPWVLTERDHQRFHEVCKNLVSCPHFLDDLWENRPPHPSSKLFEHPLTYAGQSSFEKINAARAYLDKYTVDAFLLPPESWSWLLNVRGSDLDYTPISQGFAWLTRDNIDLFLYRTDQNIEGVTVHSIDSLEDFLRTQSHLTLGYEPSQTPLAVLHFFEKKKKLKDPCVLPKACKNAIEIEGAKEAHRKDALAWHSFWQWLREQWQEKSNLTELDIVEKMLDVRKAQSGFHSLSFATIAGSGPNGAIIHYKPDASTNRVLQDNEILLIDSGAQYGEGTTDITRTLILGTPTQAMKEHYTLVLKGHIAIASAVFPKGTTGAQLDVLARNALWQKKLDFAHGTGHGVGSFLSVHEGPQRISKLGHEPLLPGMIVSNEPGYYLEGHYGIRLENLIYVVEIDKGWLGFSPLTLVPFDIHLIDFDILTNEETKWLNDYHALVERALGVTLK